MSFLSIYSFWSSQLSHIVCSSKMFSYYLSHALHKNWILHWGFLQQMWPNSQFFADLITFTEKILNIKLHFFVQWCWYRVLRQNCEQFQSFCYYLDTPTNNINSLSQTITAWKVSKYGVIPVTHFPVFELNTEKYRPEITPYLDTFHAVNIYWANILNKEGR